MRNRQKRRTYVAPSNTRVEEQHRRITARQQREPDTEELCGVCGNVRMWVRGETFPLCGQHRAVVALVGLITQDEEDLAGLRRLVTA